MTATTDARAITPTANATKLSTAAGASVAQLMTSLLLNLAEVQIKLKTIIALTPSGDANLSALNALMAELA
jgi:hypothetical protein